MTPLISAQALHDYRAGTAMLRDAVEAGLDAAVPSGTTEVALWGLDAVTPVAIDAARRRGLHVSAVYVSDAALAGDWVAGVPVFSPTYLTPAARTVMVVLSSEPDEVAAARRHVGADCVIALAQESAMPGGAPDAPRITHLGNARALREAGRFDEAYTAYQAQLLSADAAETLREAAEVAARAGRIEPAIRLYRRLLRRHPADAAVVMYRIGSFYQQLGRHERARGWFGRVLDVPGVETELRAGSHFHLGGLCLAQQDAAGAAAHFRAALHARPDHRKAKELLDALAA
jgi:tetratricopeptide (TPR) repeat protein